MNEKKYLKIFSSQSNDEQRKYLLDINPTDTGDFQLQEKFQQILVEWFEIYGENNRMTFQQFFYFWVRNTDKQASREPENISKNFFNRHISDGSSDWSLDSFLSYFKEKSFQRPNLILRMLLCHDYDLNLLKLRGTASLLNTTYGSLKIYEDKDINLFKKREDCNKITFISKQYSFQKIELQLKYSMQIIYRLEDSSKFNIFLKKITSSTYLYEGYYGVFVMDEYLKFLNLHRQYIQRIDIKPFKVTSFIRVKFDEINQFAHFLTGNKEISIIELILNINFEKQRSQMNESSWENYQKLAQNSIKNLHEALKIHLLYNIKISHFKYRLKIADEVFSKEDLKSILDEMCTIPIRQKMLLFFQAAEKSQTSYRKEIYWDCFNIVFGKQYQSVSK